LIYVYGPWGLCWTVKPERREREEEAIEFKPATHTKFLAQVRRERKAVSKDARFGAPFTQLYNLEKFLLASRLSKTLVWCGHWRFPT
jgi:hypothetical protein